MLVVAALCILALSVSHVVAGALSGLGLSMSHLVAVHLYVANMADFAAINRVYASYFSVNPPTRFNQSDLTSEILSLNQPSDWSEHEKKKNLVRPRLVLDQANLIYFVYHFSLPMRMLFSTSQS